MKTHKKITYMIERTLRNIARNIYKKIYGYNPYLVLYLFISGIVNMNILLLQRIFFI